MYEIRHYVTPAGKDVFLDWRRKLRDVTAATAVDRRVMRVETGNFGDYKPCQDGVWELRIDIGPGYRVYYAIAAKTVILLLCGGDKRAQDADVEKACKYWQDWQGRSSDER
jgi:putative addiction module killer protein